MLVGIQQRRKYTFVGVNIVKLINACVLVPLTVRTDSHEPGQGTSPTPLGNAHKKVRV